MSDLFDIPTPLNPEPKAKRPRKPRKFRHGWTIEPHVCRVCLGRVLSRTNRDESKTYQCSNCGLQGTATASSICSCGSKFNTGRDIGIRCMPNPNITPATPSEIVSGEPS